MKRLHKLLFTSILTLSAGLLTLGALNTNNNIAIETKAQRTEAITGFYERVTSTSGIAAGDTVLLVSKTGEVLQDIGGNPAYLYTTGDKVYFSQYDQYLFSDGAFINELTVRTGSTTGSFAFQGDFEKWGHVFNGQYIGYDLTGSSSEYPGRPDYDSIGFFKDGTGLRHQIDDKSSFILESYDAVNGNMNIKCVGTDSYLGFTVSYDHRFIIGGGEHGVNLYKKVTLNHIAVMQAQTKTTYNQGDELDLSGLEVRVTYNTNQVVEFTYVDNEDLFVHSKYAYHDSDDVNMIWFADTLNFNVTVIVNPSSGQYRKVTDSLSDYEGDYRIASYYNSNYFVAAFTGSAAYKSATIDDGHLDITDGNKPTVGDFSLEKDGSVYYLINDDGKYVKASYNEMYSYWEFVGTYDKSEAFSVDVVVDDNQLLLQKHDTDLYLAFDGSMFGFATTGVYASLYRKLTDAELESLTTFIDDFHKATKVCNPDGNNMTVSTSTWANQKSAYNALDEFVKVIVSGTTYSHNNETYGSLADIVDRYDYIISKYSDYEDFMARKSNAAYENHYNGRSNLFPSLIDDEVTPIILVVSLLSIVSIIAFTFYVKKRKHQ